MHRKIKRGISFLVWLKSYFFVFIVSKPFVSLSVSYEDREFKGVKRPMIVTSNHKGPFDPWMIFLSLPFRVYLRLLPIRPFAKRRFKNKRSFLGLMSSLGIVGFIYYIYNVITIPDSDSFEDKIQPLLNALKKEDTILMFPEGGFFLNDGVGEFKKGTVVLQERTGVPILPCAVRYGEKGLFRTKIYVTFGKTFFIPKELLNNSEDYMEAREYLKEEILRLYKKNNVG